MQALVIKVEMTKKEEGDCEIALIPQTPLVNMELSSPMGARRLAISNNLVFDQALIRPRRTHNTRSD